MIAIGIIPGSDIMNCMENVTSKPLICKWTTPTQYTGQFNTSVYILGTSYMCTKVVLEYNVKNLQIATR